MKRFLLNYYMLLVFEKAVSSNNTTERKLSYMQNIKTASTKTHNLLIIP